MTLVPCPSCARHVRAEESACPFCASALPSALASRAVPGATRRLDRLAAFTFAASVAVAGCAAVSGGDENAEQQEGELGSVQPMYGMPPEDGGVDAAIIIIRDASIRKDSGKPTKDAGPSPCADGGGVYPMYGMPPPPCTKDDGGGGVRDDGGVHPMYGMPASEEVE